MQRISFLSLVAVAAFLTSGCGDRPTQPGSLRPVSLGKAAAEGDPTVDLAAGITGPATALTAEPITYVGTATNIGTAPGDGTLRFRFPETADLVSMTTSAGSCSISTTGTGTSVSCRNWTLNAGESVTASIALITTRTGLLRVVAIVQNDDPSSEVDNTNDETDVITDISQNPETPPPVDLAIAVTAPATVKAGNELAFEVTVTNNSADVIASGVRVKQTGWFAATGSGVGMDCFSGTCVVGALSPGQSKTATFSKTAMDVGSVTLTATVTSNTPEADPANNTASASAEVIEGADLVLIKSAPAQVSLGETFTYDITVRNDGGASAGAIVRDDIPRFLIVQSATPSAGSCIVVETTNSSNLPIERVTCDLGPMAAGASATIQIETLYAEGASVVGNFTNRASVDAADGDIKPLNNFGSATTIFGPSDLQAGLTGPATALTDEPITYIGTATNLGPDRASGTLRISVPDGNEIVSATPSDGTCSISTTGTRETAVCRNWTLNAGESVTVEFVAISPNPRSMTVIAEVTNDARFAELNNDNDVARVTTAVRSPTPVVGLAGSVAVQEGATETYTFSVITASGRFTLVSALCGDAGEVVDGSLQVTASLGSFQCRFADGPASSSVSVSARDETHSTTGSANRAVTVSNVAPTASFALSAASVPEGSSFTIALNQAQDVPADLASLTFAFDCGSGYGSSGPSAMATCPTVDDAVLLTRAKVLDKDGAFTEYSGSVTVVNAAPVLGPITAPVDPQLIGSVIVASAQYTDAGAQDTHAALVDWGDGSQDQMAVSGGAISANHVYVQPGVYRIRMKVTDNQGAASNESVFEFVVAYDPSGPFVTGGGWIWSPLGACELSPGCIGVEGKATFGFVAKYQKGVAQGNTQFQFQAGNLHFHGSAYEWLVVAGPRAQFRGSGTINGQGSYQFSLTAIDGQEAGGGGVDRMRLKIWDAASGALVYDNQKGKADDSSDATQLGGGSIVIHTKGT